MGARYFAQDQWEKVAMESEFQLPEMAKRCGISVRQLQLDFAQQFQKNPKRWIRELRGRLIKQMIKEGLRSDAIAAELHYADSSHMCHDFRKLHGMSPRQAAFGNADAG